MRPQSVHKWRQSDCASIALNYYQGGMHFFHPETHNLTSDNGTDSKCCTSEIPILYYVVAILYKIFGVHEYIFRILNTLLFFLGLFYLFRLLDYLLNNRFWSITLSLLFFTSPVLVFYGNNFLSNSAAFSFSLIGWYYFAKYYFEEKLKWFYFSMFIFLMAASFKVTALFSLFAIIGIFFLEYFNLISFNEDRKIFQKPFWKIITFCTICLIIGSWITYAHIYNQKHDCYYFSTTTFPIWKLNGSQILYEFGSIRKVWLPEYFHSSVIIFISLCFIYIIVYFKKLNKIFLYSILIILAEFIVFIVLQFWTFENHDYYVIDMYILPVLIIISAFSILKKYHNKIFSSIFLKTAFMIFLLFNVYYAHEKLNARYKGWMNDYPEFKDIYTITPYLRSLGISAKDTVISIPDYSNATLYLMNQKGWTEYVDARFNIGKPIRYNIDSAGIQSSINKGAKYLILNGYDNLYTKPYLQSYCKNLVGHFNNVLIFNLRNKTVNFELKKKTIKHIYLCDNEHLTQNLKYFRSNMDSLYFDNVSARSSEFAHSGKYSSKIYANSPYGMTCKINNLNYGESLLIKVWEKTLGKSNCSIIVSSSQNNFYKSDYKIIQSVSDNWKQISMEVFVSEELNNHEIIIYVYNPNQKPTYFDDLEIIYYKSVLNK
jgi:hypothetical protein